MLFFHISSTPHFQSTVVFMILSAVRDLKQMLLISISLTVCFLSEKWLLCICLYEKHSWHFLDHWGL